MNAISDVAPSAKMARTSPTVAGGLLAVTLMFAAAGAQAQATDAERCGTLSGQSDLAIQHCTRAIESGKISGDELARLYYNRAIEWTAKGDHDRAIADYDAAIRVSPKFADAHFNRGHSWSSKGEPDRAIADYDAAIRLNPEDPAALLSRAVEWMMKGDYGRAIADYDAGLKIDPKSAAAFLGRGRARFYHGDFERAASDIEQAFKAEPNTYTSLWLYLARKRANVINAEEMLDSETRAERARGWPGPVILLYLGRTDSDSVQAAAVDSNVRRQTEQRCEANFYMAHWHLLRGERERGLALLKEAQSGCPRDFLEYEGTVAELRRLGS
jgi:lipoprotein NlpI